VVIAAMEVVRHVEIGVLGPAVVATNDGPAAISSRRERALLAVLALEQGRFVEQEVLVDAVFGDAPPVRPRHALATLVLRLRERLGPDTVETAQGGYRLDATHVTVDAVTFAQAVKSGAGLRAAMRLWRGRPFVDLDGWPRAEPARVRLEELHDHAEELLAAQDLRAGDAGSLVGELEALVAAAPFRERRWVLLIEALYAAGRQADALAAFKRARRLLIEELGVEPGPELVAANQAVLAHDSAPHGRSTPSVLPSPLTTFIGREIELGLLGAMVSSHRLVTLVGAGGVGKSRLAQRVAIDLTERHPGGTWWVELAPATTTEAVLAAIGTGVGLSLQPSGSPEDQLVAHLRAADASLLLLDNCEHVVATVAGLVHRLLTRCPSLRILATSREPLGVAGEQLWRVASLAVPPAGDVAAVDDLFAFDGAALFVERARDANAGFVVDEASAPHVAAICRRLDGIPLALELAAARTRTLPIERIVGGLDDAFRLLTGGPRTALPRHQTLLSSILWSHDLLDATDQAVLRRLSVCPTRFDLDAAEAIAAGGDVPAGGIADSLARLVDKGLVEYDHAGGRYRILETLRQFGRERLQEADELRATRKRYARYWAQQAMAPYEPVTLRARLTDVFTMLDWAMTEDGDLADRVLSKISPSAFGLGRWPDLPRACDWVLADRERGPDWPGAVAGVSLASVLAGRGDLLDVVEEARRVARRHGDTYSVHRLSVSLAYAGFRTGDLTPAREVVADAVSSGDGVPAWQAVTGLISHLGNLGQLHELTAMCGLAAQLADELTLDIAHTGLGPLQAVADHLAGDLAAALQRVPRVPVSWELISRMWASAAARVAVDLGDAAVAELAGRLIGPVDMPRSEVYVHTVAWAAAVLADDLDGAARQARAAVASSAHITERAAVLADLAATFAAQRRWDDAGTTLDELQTVVATLTEPTPGPRARGDVVRARLLLATDQLAAADAAAHRALGTAADAGLRLIQIDALETIAVVALAAGDHADAAVLLATTTAERQRRGYLGRVTTPATQNLVERLAAAQPLAWSRGAGQSLQTATSRAASTTAPIALR
jgi:predicted ATPase/DNA-binding SARP family transcriptional activator